MEDLIELTINVTTLKTEVEHLRKENKFLKDLLLKSNNDKGVTNETQRTNQTATGD